MQIWKGVSPATALQKGPPQGATGNPAHFMRNEWSQIERNSLPRNHDAGGARRTSLMKKSPSFDVNAVAPCIDGTQHRACTYARASRSCERFVRLDGMQA